MWPYWLMFLLPSIGVYSGAQLRGSQQRLGWLVVITIFVFLIGLRYQVGGDWESYLSHFHSMRFYSLADIWSRGDPGYYWLNWIIFELGGSILWVNLVCAVLVMVGVSYFSRHQPLPWLSMTVAVPYLIVVVAMGYSRQAAALGLAMVGLTALGKHQIRRFVAYVVLGALFHKSAILLLPIAALAATRRKLWTAVWVGVVAALGAYLLVSDTAEILWKNYVEAGYQSQGGLIRVIMNAVPSVILVVYRKSLFYNEQEKHLWLWMAVLSLTTLPLVAISSTAVDRVALYFIPIQMFAFSRLPFLAGTVQNYNLIVMGILGYYALVLFVWLNFASHAYAWLPYQSYLFR